MLVAEISKMIFFVEKICGKRLVLMSIENELMILLLPRYELPLSNQVLASLTNKANGAVSLSSLHSSALAQKRIHDEKKNFEFFKRT